MADRLLVAADASEPVPESADAASENCAELRKRCARIAQDCAGLRRIARAWMMYPIGVSTIRKRIMKKADAFSLAKKHERKHENELSAIPCRR